MILRRRYYTWLFKAYIKRWNKAILLSLLFGALTFFLILYVFQFLIAPIFSFNTKKIGYFGTFTIDTLPDEVKSQVSYGLVSVSPRGEIKDAAASSWQVKNDGKEYIFKIKKGQYFHNHEELTAYNLPFEFKDVKKKPMDRYTIAYQLKKPYSPFLISVSKPILLKGAQGLGPYKIVSIKLNANFVRSTTLENVTKSTNKEIIYFYPTEKALKIAFSLGEVDHAKGLTDLTFNGSLFSSWKTVKTIKKTNYEKMVSLFYNNNDKFLSDKKIRQALNYALPERFKNLGERAYSPYSTFSIYYNKPAHYQISDLEIAKALISSSNISPKKINLTISTTNNFGELAQLVADEWKKLGINVSIKTLEEYPLEFQIVIRPLKIPKDPDQYTLWHSDQINNISHYKNLRIDKLLEDGRVIMDKSERIKIYADFQKYLLDDVPASFLYYPFEYNLERE